MFLFVTQVVLVFIVRIWAFWSAIWIYLKSLNGVHKRGAFLVQFF